MDEKTGPVGDEKIASSPSAVESTSVTNKNIVMETESSVTPVKVKTETPPKISKSKTSSKKSVPKGKDNIFKRLSIASITKGSRPPKTKKVKEKSSPEVHDDDDDEEKLVIDIPNEATKKSPESSQKVPSKVKRLSSTKKHVSKHSSSKKTLTGSSSPVLENSNTPKSGHSSSSLKVTVKSENGTTVPESKIQPFLYGWRREVVLRATIDAKKKAPVDIYYFSPRGKKLRSMPEIISYLRDTIDKVLTPENFTFLKEPIYTAPMETVRQAKTRHLPAGSSALKPVKVKKVSKPSTPVLPTSKPPTPVTPINVLEGDADLPMAEGNENSTPVDDPNAPLGKRGRKIKSLPPDFMSPDDVSRKKFTTTVKSIPTPVKPSPLKLSETNAEASNNSSDKLVKKGQKRKLPPKPLTGNDTPGSPPAKKMAILSPHQIKKEVLSASDSEKSPAPHRSTPENHVMGDQSPQKDDAVDSGKARPRVCFTFGKLNKIPNVENNNNIALSDNNVEAKKSQVIPFKKRRVTNTEPIKVSQNDRMCSLTCPGRQAQLPMLSCHDCLCLFHPECVGFLNGLPTEDFKCQRCLYQPYLKASEPKPAAILVPKTDANKAIDEDPDKGSNIASSDDDENFLTAPPDMVLDPSQLAKDPTASLTIDDITARPLNENEPALDFKKTGNETQETKENDSNLANEIPEADVKANEVNQIDNSKEKATSNEETVVEQIEKDSSLSNPERDTSSSLTSNAELGDSPLVSLVSLVSASGNQPIQHKEGCLSAINSTGVPLMMPLMNTPGQLGPISSPLKIPNSMIRPLMNLPGTSNHSLQIPRPGTVSSPFSLASESLLGVNNQNSGTIPVNVLHNAAPIVVGTQVLTPVSINLTGFAKGTVIYTNNPTLRFLLPSSTGLASFGVTPGTTTCHQNLSSNFSNEPLQNSSAVLSQFLPVTPPIQVINVKEYSLCDLMLKIPVNDGHLFSPKVILKTGSEDPIESSEVPSVSENSDPQVKLTLENEIPDKSQTESSVIMDTNTAEPETPRMDPPGIDTVVSIMALNEPCSDNIDKNTVEYAPKNNQKETDAIEKAELIVKMMTKSLENNSTKDESSVDKDNLDIATETLVQNDKEEAVQPPLDEFADLSGPVLSPSNPVFEDDELYNPVDIESNNWWLSESENEDGKRDEEPEPEYRPTSPVILSRVEYDGFSRVVSTTLANRGANISGEKDSCARVAKYRRPESHFRRQEEHSYSMSDQNHIFKKKKVTTLRLPKKPFQIIQSASETLNLVFDYLNIPDLLNARLVCKTWKKIASQSHLWSTVKLKGVKILDWKLCAIALEQHNTSLLDMRGLIQRPDQWYDFLASIYRLRKVQGVVFGEVPSWVISSVVNGLPDLLCLEAEEIVNDRRELVFMDPGVLAQLQQMNILRIRAPHGMQVPEYKLYGGLSSLGLVPHLTHLSLTSLRKLDNDDVVFLEHLPHLQVLEIGQCRTWTELAYHRLGKLRSLRRLRLEMGGAFADRGLANALIQMSRLQELTLLAYRITTSMAASIRRLRHLWHLTIWPDMSSEGAMVVYNTLQAVRNLKRLQSFSWGIIYQDDNSTRYSRKHGKGKYRENPEVDEWWSEELRNTPRAKGIKIPMLKAFSETMPATGSKNDKGSVPEPARIPASPTTPGGMANPGMEQGLIGVGHLRQKLQKLLPESEIYVYQVPESLLSRVYGESFNVVSATSARTNSDKAETNVSATMIPYDNSAFPPR